MSVAAAAAPTPPSPGAELDGEALVAWAAAHLQDPLGRELAARVRWWELPGLEGRWPVAVLGEGPPVLLLHGFDSSFLEYRRLAPLLAGRNTLLIPDLHGFGFSPRLLSPRLLSARLLSPRLSAAEQGPEPVLRHLEALLEALESRAGIVGPLGLIGASMGGSVAVCLARRNPQRFERLLLLAPAGLTGRPMPLPPLLDQLGVRFLALPGVRQGLCRSAFADPEADVGAAELEIASLHLATAGWAPALARFARSGGFAGCGAPLPPQPLEVLWGANDRILRAPQKRAAQQLLGERITELERCGHLPHIDRPQTVAERWLAGSA